MKLRAALVALLTCGALVAPSQAEAANPAEIVRQVTHQDQTVTVRLHPVSMRAPGFEVLLQQPDGSLVKQPVPEPRSYLGSVDGRPDAVASGVIMSDGSFDGQVVFDRGATWQFKDSAVYSTRGLTPPTTFAWPSATDQARNVSVAPGQVGGTTYRWDIGFDLDNAWFTSAPVSGSVEKAIDLVELSAVSLLDLYVPNALIQPAVGRVVIRGSVTHDPYAADGPTLGKLKDAWASTPGMDSVALLDEAYGGGVAFLSTAGTTSGLSINGGAGASRAVLRHELGHNWGASDNHTNGPEGQTVMSGNAYERFDGTELSAMMRYRDSRQKATAPFTGLGTFAEPVPPYAALDLVDLLTGGVRHSFRPVANDHDANLDKLSLVSVQALSHLGGAVTRRGNVITYRPPIVATRTVDWVQYVVRDASGRTATGVSLFRVDPGTGLAPVASWAATTGLVRGVPYDVVNTQSGLPAGVRGRTKLVQRSTPGPSTKVKLVKRGRTWQVRSTAVRGCWVAAKKKRIELAKCGRGKDQRWRIVAHPKLGSSIVNLKTNRCAVPAKASMNSGAKLVLRRCGYSHAQSWRLTGPPVTAWQAARVPTGQRTLTQVASGLTAGVPDGASGPSDLVLRSPSGNRTLFTFSDAHTVRNVQTGQCIDVYSSETSIGAKVGTWSCGSGANQSWQVLLNPAGGVSLRAAHSGLCLSSGPAGLVQVTCGYDAAQRWRVG